MSSTEEKNLKEQKSAELEELKKQINVLKGKVATLELNKSNIEKEAEEMVGRAIYEKRKEIDRSYSEVLKEAEQRLKSKEKEKVDERRKNISRVVEENTKETKNNIVYLKNNIKSILRANKLPSFVDSKIYMGVWYPTTIAEWIIGIAVAIIILLIPTIIAFGISKKNLIEAFPNAIFRGIIITLIYFGVIFIAGIIWLLVDKITKNNLSVLKEVKEIRKNIEECNKKIEEITKETNKEMTDDKFDYTKIDRAIEAGRIEVEEYKKKKEDALSHFDNVTLKDVQAKAKTEVNKKIKPIKTEIEQVKKSIDSLQKKHDELKLKLASEE